MTLDAIVNEAIDRAAAQVTERLADAVLERAGKVKPHDLTQLRTVKQLAAECPAISESLLYSWIRHADTNGLGNAVLRAGGKVVLHRERLFKWLES